MKITFIFILEIILFSTSAISILINCLKPLFYIYIFSYKIHILTDKKIKPNINHNKKIAYLHLPKTIESIIIIIVVLNNLVKYFL
jgi:hypothetical protein